MNFHNGVFMCLIFRTVLLGVVFLLARMPVYGAPDVPPTVLWQEAIEYSRPTDESLQINIARPKQGDGPFPTVLCIHGGGFRAGKRESYDPLCIKLAERGYVAATMTYRLAPKHQFPAAVQHCRQVSLHAHRLGVSQHPAKPRQRMAPHIH